MKDVLEGLREFQSSYVPNNQDLLTTLARGQHPRVLFVACSDSRVPPELITQSEPGELFVIRNAGNIIPPYGATNGGEGATVEYAIKSLDIRQVIVCGHTTCGAMKGLLQVGELEETMPLVYSWLKHTEATRELVEENYGHLGKAEKLSTLIAENVLTQIENLRTYPVVRSRLHTHKLTIHGWIYNIADGSVVTYDRENRTFVPLFETYDPDSDGGVYEQLKENYRGSSRLSQVQRDRIYHGSSAFYS